MTPRGSSGATAHPSFQATRHNADDAGSIAAQARLESSRQRRRIWGAAVVLAVVVAATYCAWVLVPIYYDDYSIQDACREALRRSHDAPIELAAFGKEAIGRRIQKADVRIDRVQLGGPGTDRALQLEYTRFVEIVPGWRHPWRFRHFIEVIGRIEAKQ